ncbi:DUF6262 family protein [Bacillus albus]|uniref:DUF6262 family protein n=1 Tax=Bacillus cereus group TaxID=86661 RepID=UPI000BF03B1A|nr:MULTISPECIES: DUF6262 family protein [Bacillus cereus group]MDA2028283.1 DUF6262 family protein [Bacillus cereus group sp. Bcc03]MDA2218290.1 DUF6262 family protein [Bacillus cereus group sp. Bc228]MDA2228747.1 DUF6262 family protein [Bacillus cereus group sp. Bc227]MDA2262669.1 DUF6262 family protein [Bacillus cereus group sp. Bc200]MDA2714969.1 DUF6262 family protein [Bacillus cereus group sp. Bc025]
MKDYNRVQHLKKIHASRKIATYQKVDEGIKRLLRTNQSINFNSVSKESGVSKATLYKTENLRNRIEMLRYQESQVSTPKQLKREMNDNNKDAVIASLKRRIKKLENENKELREQLKINYADIYKQL